MSLKLLAAIVPLLLAICLLSGNAWAEVNLVQSIPANGEVLAHTPDTVTLRFDGPIIPAKTNLILTEASGRSAPALPKQRFASAPADHLTVVMPILRVGAYALRFRVVGTDGRPGYGIVRFTSGGY